MLQSFPPFVSSDMQNTKFFTRMSFELENLEMFEEVEPIFQRITILSS